VLQGGHRNTLTLDFRRRGTSSVEARGIAGFLEGLVGPGSIEGLISHFLGGGSSSKRSLVGLAEGLAEPIVSGGTPLLDAFQDVELTLHSRWRDWRRDSRHHREIVQVHPPWLCHRCY
jgi:hypothetical protein